MALAHGAKLEGGIPDSICKLKERVASGFRKARAALHLRRAANRDDPIDHKR